MKRIQNACLLQTIRFQLRDGSESANPAADVQAEVAHYKEQLKRSYTKYQIDSEEVQPDGSVIVKIRKQYNNYEVGDYFKG